MKLFLSQVASPLGIMLLITDAQGAVRALDFADHKARMGRHPAPALWRGRADRNSSTGEVVYALDRYFAGELEVLDTLRTHAAALSLQRRIWEALRSIPAGTTTTCGRLANELGIDDPRAPSCMGVANRANPIAIIIPCAIESSPAMVTSRAMPGDCLASAGC